jgi:hypothetical protein
MKLPFTSKTLLVCAAFSVLQRGSILGRAIGGIGFAVAALTIFACSTAQGPFLATVAPSKSASTQCTTAIPNPPTFMQNLRMLSGYTINQNPTNGQTLPAPGISQIPDVYCTTLFAAYTAAHKDFQKELDNLTNTFIDTDACSGSGETCAWGFTDLQTGNGQHKYIALPASLWTGTSSTSTVSYSSYGTFAGQLVIDLLAANGMNPAPAASPITVSAVPDGGSFGPSLVLLAALAHEMGHIDYWKDQVQAQGCQNDPIAPGTNSVFSGITWTTPQPTPPWRQFGRATGNVNIDGIAISALIADLQNGTNPYSDLSTFYDGRWASIFASVSPDEDYVETYALEQVIRAMRKQQPSGTSLTVALQGAPPGTRPIDMLSYHDSRRDSHDKDLHHKAQWVQKCGM